MAIEEKFRRNTILAIASSVFAILFIMGCNSSGPDKKSSAAVKTEDLHGEEYNIGPCQYESNAFFDTSSLYKNSTLIEIYAYKTPFNGEVEDGKSTFIKHDEKLILTKPQKDSLFKLLTSFKQDTYVSYAECYEPRHRIIFRDNKNRSLGNIDICFTCNQTASYLELFDHMCSDQLSYYQDFLKWCGLTVGFPKENEYENPANRVFYNGKITEYETDKPLEDVKIEAYENDKKMFSAVSNEKGDYRLDLLLVGHRYNIKYYKPNHLLRTIILDLRNIPDTVRPDEGYELEANMTMIEKRKMMKCAEMFNDYEGDTAGILKYREVIGDLGWNEAEVKAKKDIIDKCIETTTGRKVKHKPPTKTT